MDTEYKVVMQFKVSNNMISHMNDNETSLFFNALEDSIEEVCSNYKVEPWEFKEDVIHGNIFIKIADAITGLKSTIDDKDSAEHAVLNDLVKDLAEAFKDETTFDKVIFFNDCEEAL